VSCNRINNFILINATCICIDNFEIKGDRCVDICGDGRLYELECDDGNL